VGELAAGHNVAAEWDDDTPCQRIRTAWMPQAVVPRVEPHKSIAGERLMEVLGAPAGLCCCAGGIGPAASRIPCLDQ